MLLNISSFNITVRIDYTPPYSLALTNNKEGERFIL